MTTVGIIGSGRIGTTIARLAIDAGHRVVLSNSRGPESLAATVAELGPHASAAASDEAATAGDIVVIVRPPADPGPPAGRCRPLIPADRRRRRSGDCGRG